MMYNNFFSHMFAGRYSDFMNGWMGGWWMPWFFLAVAWALVWKGLALWKAARKGERVWFVALLIINTLGILEILYLYVYSEKSRPVK